MVLDGRVEAIDAFDDYLNEILFDRSFPQPSEQIKILHVGLINTPVGPMLAIADHEAIFLLEFLTKKLLRKELQRLKKRGFVFIRGLSQPLLTIRAELASYFDGHLTRFETPYYVYGSSFQQEAWIALTDISYGETCTYTEQANKIGKPQAVRAVANANAANQLSIIIPCHRVIASNGTLGGYSGGIAIKQWLLNHEKNML
ncbi:MAG: methylated-DNA--[protein]-cysteine S-methyltransferase [Legionella sp.]